MIEFWYLFPLGVAIAACATSASISGSNFWTPVYLLAMGLETKVAFWMSLLTMLFGFGSGVWRNLRDRTVNAYLIGRYLRILAPAAALGALASAKLRSPWLLAAFAAFVLIYGLTLIVQVLRRDPRLERPEPHDRVFWGIGALAGTLQGLIASGAGVLLMPAILDHRRIRHHAEAVGSTVVLVFVASLISLALRVDGALLAALVERSGEIAGMIAFAAPGVVIGGQLGPRLARRLPRRQLRLWVAALLVFVGLLVGYRAVVG